MSYLPDQPLSAAEERILNYEEQRFNNPRKKQLRIIDKYEANRNHGWELNFKSDLFKIDLKNKKEIFINQNLLEKINKMIKRKYGDYAVDYQIIVDSITIVPVQNGMVEYYFQPEDVKEEPSFDLIGRFVAGPLRFKYEIACPYVDSAYETRHLVFPFYKNAKDGKIFPKNYITEYVSAFAHLNTTYPFVSTNVRGQYYFKGITDAVGLRVTFKLPDKIHGPQSRLYRHNHTPTGDGPYGQFHVRRMPRKIKADQYFDFNEKTGVGYLLSLPDYSEDGDPLLEAFS